jgi:acyl carrier protein
MQLDESVIKKEISEFLKENFFLGDLTIKSNDSFLETGVVDSTGILELIGFIEEKFGIKIHDDEMLPENLDSIDNICTFLLSKVS